MMDVHAFHFFLGRAYDWVSGGVQRAIFVPSKSTNVSSSRSQRRAHDLTAYPRTLRRLSVTASKLYAFFDLPTHV